MKSIALIVLASATAFAANASCFGSSNIYSCNDQNGNTYNVQKFGNTTNMQGYNASTGSTWSQNSQTYGNSTFIQGNSNGNSWNQTIQTMPGMTTYSGTDSSGNSFHKTCTAYGCY